MYMHYVCVYNDVYKNSRVDIYTICILERHLPTLLNIILCTTDQATCDSLFPLRLVEGNTYFRL